MMISYKVAMIFGVWFLRNKYYTHYTIKAERNIKERKLRCSCGCQLMLFVLSTFLINENQSIMLWNVNIHNETLSQILECSASPGLTPLSPPLSLPALSRCQSGLSSMWSISCTLTRETWHCLTKSGTGNFTAAGIHFLSSYRRIVLSASRSIKTATNFMSHCK